jgi:hypothetical protein
VSIIPCSHSSSNLSLLLIDPKLPGLLKMLICIQNLLDEKVSYPHITDLVNANLEDPEKPR